MLVVVVVVVGPQGVADGRWEPAGCGNHCPSIAVAASGGVAIVSFDGFELVDWAAAIRGGGGCVCCFDRSEVLGFCGVIGWVLLSSCSRLWWWWLLAVVRCCWFLC